MARNNKLHKDSNPNPLTLFKHINSTGFTHLKAWKSLTPKPIPWLLQPLSHLKINFDTVIGSSYLDFFAIGTNIDGSIIFSFTTLGPSYNLAEGEAFVALHAVKSAIAKQCQHILLKGDSLSVILSIKNPTSPIIRKLSHHLWSAIKIDRSANLHAHNIAH